MEGGGGRQRGSVEVVEVDGCVDHAAAKSDGCSVAGPATARWSTQPCALPTLTESIRRPPSTFSLHFAMSTARASEDAQHEQRMVHGSCA